MDVNKQSSDKKDVRDKLRFKYARKLAFSKFVRQLQLCPQKHSTSHNTDLRSTADVQCWQCCSCIFTATKDIHCHVAKVHKQEILEATSDILMNGSSEARWKCLKNNSQSVEDNCEQANKEELDLPCHFEAGDIYPWLPEKQYNCVEDKGRVLLFYKYRPIQNTKHVQDWQRELCIRLNLAGKIRVAIEGINATVGGTEQNTSLYITAVKNHPLFLDMTDWDFKCSEGGSDVFPDGLKIGIYEEIVPMGINPQEVSHEKGGLHLTVEEFHEAVQNHLKHREKKDDSLFIDCRNFYESKIGHFAGALCPDIRKFSYWPEYVDKNAELFKDKRVYMYCTGGIRCERGSAYLLSKGICNDVYQLKGGIHKYIEKYPDGFFRGKLFVFDDRYHITANDDILSKCCYCSVPWDKYEPCTSSHCHQLVLACDECRNSGLTACCSLCQSQHEQRSNVTEEEKREVREECNCTKNRSRIPVETLPKIT